MTSHFRMALTTALMGVVLLTAAGAQVNDGNVIVSYLGLDNVFLASAGADNAVFTDFIGFTDGAGDATASINLPASLPSNIGLAIFAAGVIFDLSGRVQTITSTHWFVLR